MSRRKYHIPGLPEALNKYADRYGLDFNRYSDYHMRLMDGGYTVLDIWTTGRYFIMTTDYAAMGMPGYAPGVARKGEVPSNDKLPDWLERIFFPENLTNETE